MRIRNETQILCMPITAVVEITDGDPAAAAPLGERTLLPGEYRTDLGKSRYNHRIWGLREGVRWN
jgi:hypothetical protein